MSHTITDMFTLLLVLTLIKSIKFSSQGLNKCRILSLVCLHCYWYLR